MNYIELKQITSHYGKTRILNHVSLSIQKGELHTLLGPSGCGKTTLLRLIGGFLSPTSGSIWLDGRDITATVPEKREMGIVFQNYALFPNLNVTQNVSYGLKLKHMPQGQLREITEFYLNLVDLWEYRTRKIQQLSGGQQQRVAIARALATDPKVLLLDEPMSNLDVSLRLKMRMEIRKIQQKVGITTLFITHDQQEALAISDTISVMNNGHIEQSGSPREIYESPQTDFVATFVGKTNRLDSSAMKVWNLAGENSSGHVYVRPEQLFLHHTKTADTPVSGQILSIQYQGAMIEYIVSTAVGDYTVLMLNQSKYAALSVGDPVFLGLR